MIAQSAMSVGYGREVGVIMLIYIMAFAYAACSPIILPFTLCYFTSIWVRTSITRDVILKTLCGRSATHCRHAFHSLFRANCYGAASSATSQRVASSLAAVFEPDIPRSQPGA